LREVKDLIENDFQLKVEMEVAANVGFFRVSGLDNYSLARWIAEKIDHVIVSVKQREGYKFNNDGWVKVEKTEGDTRLVLV
jgi:hypothetical protein